MPYMGWAQKKADTSPIFRQTAGNLIWTTHGIQSEQLYPSAVLWLAVDSTPLLPRSARSTRIDKGHCLGYASEGLTIKSEPIAHHGVQELYKALT